MENTITLDEFINSLLHNLSEDEKTKISQKADERIQKKISENPNMSQKIKSEIQRKIIANEMMNAVKRTDAFKKYEAEVEAEDKEDEEVENIYHGVNKKSKNNKLNK